MMRLPLINTVSRTRKQEGVFGGLDTREIVQDGYFADMKNMSSDYYPAAGPREARGAVIKILEKPNGLYWKNGLAYVDGTKLYYNDQEKGEVTDSKKIMVGMGAYIIILPDKVYLNTDSGEFGSMEKTFTQASTATFAPSYTGSTYTKISCTGIGKQFNQYDGVEISGCTNADYNKTATIQAKTDDSITVIGTLEKSFTQDSGLTLKRKVPDMDFLTECENRLWGCSSKNHEVYASKLGDPLNWNVFEGISTDSYAATIGSDGDFTAAATYSGYALFFKEHTIHKVYGNKPSNIQIHTQEAPGVMKGCNESVRLVGTTLIYLSDTVCMGIPEASRLPCRRCWKNSICRREWQENIKKNTISQQKQEKVRGYWSMTQPKDSGIKKMIRRCFLLHRETENCISSIKTRSFARLKEEKNQ